MNILEKEIEDLIYEACMTDEGRRVLAERGLEISGKVTRQSRLGNYGITDLISIEEVGEEVHVNIYELKRGDLELDGIIQLCRYITGMRRHLLRENNYEHEEDAPIKVFGTIICKNIPDTNDMVYLLNELPINAFTFNIDLEYGLYFDDKSDGWRVTNEDWSSTDPIFTKGREGIDHKVIKDKDPNKEGAI